MNKFAIDDSKLDLIYEDLMQSSKEDLVKAIMQDMAQIDIDNYLESLCTCNQCRACGKDNEDCEACEVEGNPCKCYQ